MATQFLGQRQKLLDENTTANAESAVFSVIGWLFKSFHIINPGAETVQIFKSLDDESESMSWVQHGEDITDEAAFVTMHEAVRFVKVVRGSGTSSVTVILAVSVVDK